ncbi:hypothetical protein [Chryseobacterium kwangjuense]|nr:hypothetical protein [Chryseobacterium kwangjuense]
MRTNSIFLGLMLSISVFSQTKIIAFKSHNGQSENFRTAVYENLFDANLSNLGDPKPNFQKATLDSLIILDDGEGVLVASSLSDLFFDAEKRKKQPIREVVHKRVLFSKKNIDSVKAILKRDYHFDNNVDSAIVVKYDKEKKSYKEVGSSMEKPKKDKSEKTRGGLLLGILMLAGVSGFYSWKKNKRNNEK